TATAVTITPATTVSGTLTASSGVLSNSLDRATAGTLTIGGATATAVTITPATTVSGTLTASSGVLSNSLDRAAAGALTIGGTTATSLTLGRDGQLTSF